MYWFAKPIPNVKQSLVKFCALAKKMAFLCKLDIKCDEKWKRYFDDILMIAKTSVALHYQYQMWENFYFLLHPYKYVLFCKGDIEYRGKTLSNF